jgi:hypothetical protein
MKVLKPFTCKVTKRRYEAGDVYEGARGEELAAKGLVEEVIKEKAEVSHTPKYVIDAEGEPTKKRTRKK